MQDQRPSGGSPSNQNMWTFTFLATLFVLAALIAAGMLALIPAMQQAQTPTGSQSVPTR